MEQIQCNRCQEVKERTPDNFRKNRRICRTCEREESRKNSFKILRGISHEERDQLLVNQSNKCGCCGSTQAGSVKGWHLDHNHSTGDIRSVLCATCNIALGQVDDSIERLELLIEYLRRHKVEGATTIQ